MPKAKKILKRIVVPKPKKAHKVEPVPSSYIKPEGLLDNLNDEQKQAVLHGEGPLLILAGAGTGKTRVLTHRIASLIEQKKARPEEILALTFTEKAAQEMEERVDRLVPYGYINAWIGTFHSFGDEIIRDHCLELGLPLDYQLLTEAEQSLFFLEHIFELELDILKPSLHAEDLAASLSELYLRAKDEDISPEDYLAYAQGLQKRAEASVVDREQAQIHLEVSRAYRNYDRLMKEKGKIDFGDQVWLPLKLFREHPSFLKKYQEKYKYILIDEFQDTNHAQFELIRLLATRENGPANLTVVGDDDQSIYKFRGAAISNILKFSDVFPKAKTVVLVKNYRSSQAILDSAYRLIQNNNPDRLEVKQKVSKKLVSLASLGKPPQHLHCDSLDHEADKVAETIAEKVKDKIFRYSDIAILVRHNSDADPFLRSLNMKSIPYRFSGDRGLYDKPEVKLLLCFLRAVVDVYDSVSLYQLASSHYYKVPLYDLVLLNSKAGRLNRSLREVMENRKKLEGLELSAEAEEKTAKLLEDLARYLKMAGEAPTGQLLYQFLLESGQLKRLARHPSAASEETLGHIARFFSLVKHFSQATQTDRAFEFVKHLELLKRAGDDPSAGEVDLDADAVQVLTVHKAKGLEFGAVFMVSLVDQKFPSRARRRTFELPDELISTREVGLPSTDYHVKEERRLFYVGMTRAKKELYLTSARDYGGKKLKKLSFFVMEALDMPKTKELATAKSSSEQAISRHALAPEPQPALLKSRPGQDLLFLSHNQVDDYLTCPLKYKYIHILKIPILSHHSVIFGNALHQAVGAYLRGKKAGKPVSLEEMAAVFKSAWRLEGFLHRAQEERRFQEGLDTLKRFYEYEEKQTIIPNGVEQEFSFKREGIMVKGRFDRMDGEKGSAVIIDYKSSNVTEQKKADDRAKESLQLAIYALAHQEMTGFLPQEVQLRFLESGLTGRAVKTQEHLDKAWEEVKEAAGGIGAGVFASKPDYQSCRFCAYREICPDSVA